VKLLELGVSLLAGLRRREIADCEVALVLAFSLGDQLNGMGDAFAAKSRFSKASDRLGVPGQWSLADFDALNQKIQE
jgi:hypothetical protein